MKAAVRERYGPPQSIRIEEIPMPEPANEQILVKVMATTINRTDEGILMAKPAIIRLFAGLFRPRNVVIGTDFAGVVVAVGEDVSRWKEGDRVWGFDDTGLGSHAEYTVLDTKKAIAPIPDGISFVQAAASAEGAHYAFNFINKVRIVSGAQVLVNGGTGAIGSAAIQMLVAKGAEVTAVCGTEHLDLVRSLGAKEVIDYQTSDFTNSKHQFDFVFDAVGKSTYGACKRIMKPGAVYISSELGPGAQNLFLALWTRLFGKKKVVFPVPVNIPASLEYIGQLLQEGHFLPLMDRCYSLEAVRAGYEYVLTGKKIGNVILAVNEDVVAEMPEQLPGRS